MPLGIGRRAPGGGGMGRPVALSGRPGGGGMGRPVELRGGRLEGAPSPSPEAERCVGRMVVGPSGDTVRVGAGFTTAALLRTTLGPGSGTGAGAGAASTTVSEVDGAGASTGAVFATRLTRTAGGASTGAGAASGFIASFVVVVDLVVVLVALVDLVSSGATTRRSPSVSARRRMRSAWASSIEAEGLEAPMPSFWASTSNSLLVRPSSLESSCTRIFFWAKTFPCFTYSRYRGHSYLFFHTCRGLEPRSAIRPRTTSTSPSDTTARSARATWLTRRARPHVAFRHHQTPRPTPRPRCHVPCASRPARTISVSSRRARQTTQVRTGAMPRPPRSPRPPRPPGGHPRRRSPRRRRPPPRRLGPRW